MLEQSKARGVAGATLPYHVRIEIRDPLSK